MKQCGSGCLMHSGSKRLLLYSSFSEMSEIEGSSLWLDVETSKRGFGLVVAWVGSHPEQGVHLQKMQKNI